MLDRFAWDHQKVVDIYKKSVDRRSQLGLKAIRDDIQSNQLALDHFPHHKDVGQVIPIFASTSLERPVPVAEAETSVLVEGKKIAAGDVIGCYEMRYGQGESTAESSTVTPQEFTKYMLYVTQWRWMQCEAYIHRCAVREGLQSQGSGGPSTRARTYLHTHTDTLTHKHTHTHARTHTQYTHTLRAHPARAARNARAIHRPGGGGTSALCARRHGRLGF
eukprot:3615410-Prymnesium_polylepis.1